MATANKICRVCGKEYEACHTLRSVSFRWQEVACSPECGSIYLDRIVASRATKTTDLVSSKNDKEQSVLIADDYDEFEDELEDDEFEDNEFEDDLDIYE